jgi:hypothetical protein
LTRIEFHLSDVNSRKFGTHDKRCLAEVRPAGRRPLTVTASAATVNSAVRGSLSKLRNALDSFFGRMKSRRTSIRRGTQASREESTTRSRRKAATSAKVSRALVEKARRKPAAGRRGPKKKHIHRTRRKA